MQIETHIHLIEEILGGRRIETGADHEGYKNHVYRMVNFCFALHELTAGQKEKIVIAGCFHDLGIWPGRNFDYLPPSIALARQYLAENGKSEWTEEIATMIGQHHKIRKIENEGSPLTEIFRQGDLVDFSLGLLKCGLPRGYVKEVKACFPNAGFHCTLAGVAGKWICRHPLNPVPVLKW